MVHSVSEAQKMEPVYSNMVLVGRLWRRFGTNIFVFNTPTGFYVHTVPNVEQRVCDALSGLGNLSEAEIDSRIWRNSTRPAGTLGSASVPVHTPAPIAVQPELVPADPPMVPVYQPIPPPFSLECSVWDAVLVVFQLYLLNVPTTVEKLPEWITTAFTRLIARNDFAERSKEAKDEANGPFVDLFASQKGIQALQDEASSRETDMREVREELEEVPTATESVTTHLNEELRQTGAFSRSVRPSWLSSIPYRPA